MFADTCFEPRPKVSLYAFVAFQQTLNTNNLPAIRTHPLALPSSSAPQ